MVNTGASLDSTCTTQRTYMVAVQYGQSWTTNPLRPYSGDLQHFSPLDLSIVSSFETFSPQPFSLRRFRRRRHRQADRACILCFVSAGTVPQSPEVGSDAWFRIEYDRFVDWSSWGVEWPTFISLSMLAKHPASERLCYTGRQSSSYQAAKCNPPENATFGLESPWSLDWSHLQGLYWTS